MPIKVKDNLPAKGILRGESIFVMGEDRAFHQDIRPLKILVVNLMPNKQQTEVQILRLLSNTPLQLHQGVCVKNFPSLRSNTDFQKVYKNGKSYFKAYK